jgi:hypothetical protein
MVEMPVNRTSDIPPAFYRDVDPPPPPPDDPHWREWSHDDGYERMPGWLIYGLPALLIFASIFHSAMVLIILKSGQ